MKPSLQNQLGKALLQTNPFSTRQAGHAVVNPVSEMPLILTLAQLQPNPDNPRTGRNPRYDEIKNSIRQRGLDSVPKVTQAPGSNVYIFSDGGNTRYQILSELWQETQDERFYRLHVLFKPWPGRLQCLIGHLAENEVRGELNFLEKAKGVSALRTMYEEKLGKKLSLRALAQCITADGLPISISHISKMEDTVSGLLPYMPGLLNGGLGRHQIESLLSLRSTLKRLSVNFSDHPNAADTTDASRLIDCFNETCRQVDGHDYFVFDTFVDELIGQLLRDCPQAEFDYDRWIFELKVNKGKPVITEENPDAVGIMPEMPEYDAPNVPVLPVTDESERISPEIVLPDTTDELPVRNEQTGHCEAVVPLVEIQDDLYGGIPVLSGDVSPNENDRESGIPKAVTEQGAVVTGSSVKAAEPGGKNFPQSCAELWPTLTLTNDIEHLQVQAYRTLFELSTELNLSDCFMASSGVYSPGFMVTPDNSVLSRVMQPFSEDDENADTFSVLLKKLLTGGCQPENQPVLNDAQFLMWMKLMYTLRCLFAQQRNVEPGVVVDDAEFE